LGDQDGIWYVLLNREEYEFLTQKEEERSKQKANLSSNLEKLKAGFEGSLMLIQKDRQREELFHELSSLYTLLAVKEKEIELLKKALEDREKEKVLVEELRKELKEKEKHKLEGKLKEKELELAQKDIEIQRLLLEKERKMLSLRLELEQCKKQRETE
jgi:hypothetical protein